MISKYISTKVATTMASASKRQIATFSLTGHWMFGIAYLTRLCCPIQLINLNPNLINFGNNNLFPMILKPRCFEPEIEVGIRYW